MTCPLASACLAPSCRPGGRTWQAKSSAPPNVEAFKADVVVYMQMTGERAVGRACAKVFAAAMREGGECMLS